MEKILFNITCDEKNLNGRIYPRAVVEAMVDTLNTGKIFVQHGTTDSMAVDIERVLGVVDSARITESGTVAVKFATIQTPAGKALDKLIAEHLGTGCFDLVPFGVGTVKGGVVDEYKLIYISALQPQEVAHAEPEKEKFCVGGLFDVEEPFCGGVFRKETYNGDTPDL